MRRVLLLAGLLLIGAALAWGGEEVAEEEDLGPAPKDATEAKARVEGWIQDLRSDAFEVRERARKSLQRWGEMAREAVLLHQDDPDPEVRQAVRAALQPKDAAEPPTPAPTGDLLSLGRVSLTRRGPYSDVFDALARTQGARITLPATVAGEIAVDTEEHPFFAVLHDLAAAASLDASGPFDAAGVLALLPGTGTDDRSTWSIAGPLRARPLRITTTRSLAKADERTYALTLGVQWTPGVEVVSYRLPKVVRAEDAKGRAFRATGETNTTYGIGQGSQSAEVTLSLAPAVPDVEERLAVLEVALVLRMRHGRRSVRFPDLRSLPVTLGEDGLPAEAGSRGSITLRSLTTPQADRQPLTVEVVARLDPELASRSARAFVEGEDGTRVPLLITARSTSADGLLRLTGRVYGSAAVTVPVALEVFWFEVEEEGEVRLTLQDVPLR
jgi:hypothetical protein